MFSHLDSLNPRQREAATTLSGPLLIVAGAGAGKTKTISHRILELIKTGVAPREILAITFTNKAAKEMRERVFNLIKADKELNLPISFSERPFVSTFHSLGVHIIKENSIKLGLIRNFTIFDRNDSLRAMKEAVKSANLDPKEFEPRKFLNAISWQKGEGRNLSDFIESDKGDYFSSLIAEVWPHYEKTLKTEKALDFDDLLLKTAKLLKTDTEAREHYQKIWKYIHIDEYQDTNKVQYQIAKYLTGEGNNICVVGDEDQCLPSGTKILTPSGIKRIEEMTIKSQLTSSAGDGHISEQKVTNLKTRPFRGQIIKIETETGKKLSLTPNHLIFASLDLNANIHYVYLMYKKDKGYRIGIAKGSRKSKLNETQIGLAIRTRQENADRVWVLKICPTKTVAQYWEILLATRYGIPMLVFKTSGRKMVINQKQIDQLFQSIDTVERAEKIFEETGLIFDYPHYWPQGTTRGNTKKGRVNLNLILFSDRRRSLANPWGLSRLSLNTTSLKIRRGLEQLGFKTRKGKRGDWRLEIARLDYKKIEELGKEISDNFPEINIVRTALLTQNKRFVVQPASNLQPSMRIAVWDGNRIIDDQIKNIATTFYNGAVFDLEVSNTHSFIANDIIVHNCIYSWRGAMLANLLKFEKDFPGAKVVLLEQNYRSTKNILSAANQIIIKNKTRTDKTLFTEQNEGEKLGLYCSLNETDEAQFVAHKSLELIKKGNSPKEIAVLYRANFQSRVLEEAFLMHQIPYQVLGTRFFERKEVKDVLSFIRAALNPDSSADLKRIINVPPRGIGKVTLIKILAGQENELPKNTALKVADFRQCLERIRSSVATLNPSDLVKFVLKTTGLEMLLMSGSEEEKERLENLRELATLAVRYDNLPKPDGAEKLLEDAALAADQDELIKDEKAVKLMTVHASKGLEFDHVFIAGLEDNLFPHRRIGEADLTKDEGEEERRLFYVALTRARKKVFLSYAGSRMIFGSLQLNAPSEFITDIDEILLEAEERHWTLGKEKTIYFD